MGEKRDTSTVVLVSSEHDSLGAKATMGADVLLLALDKANSITAEQHLLLGVTILEKLLS